MRLQQGHNPCFSGNSFAIYDGCVLTKEEFVTILVLVETLLQFFKIITNLIKIIRHNPCFSGNSFAIAKKFRYFKL